MKLEIVSVPDFVLLSVVASFCFALGGVLQKHGMATRLPDLHYRELFSRVGEFGAAMSKNPLWVLGFLITMLGAPFSIQAVAIGDVSVVKALMRIQMVFVVAIGVGILGERLERREWWGIICLMVGVFALTLDDSGATSMVPGTKASGLLFLLNFGLCGGLLLAHQRWPERLSHEVALALAVGLLVGAGDIFMKAGINVARAELGSFDVAQLDSLTALLSTPEIYLGITSDVTSFLLTQAAFSTGRVSGIIPIAGVGAVLFTVLVGHVFLHEVMPGPRVAAIAMIAGGALLFASREAGRADAG